MGKIELMRKAPALPTEVAGPLFLGIEAGGTRTVGLLVNDRGDCVQRIEAGPANMRLMSEAQLMRHFRLLAAQIRLPAALGIGMAGVFDESERRRVRVAAAKAWPGLPCWTGSDLETALAAADGCCTPSSCARVIIISGTGSCCYGRNPSGQVAKAGGWGHVLGDRGSGYDIALSALRAAMMEYDRSGRWPRLGAEILRALLLNSPNELVSWAQGAAKPEIAALAIEVFSSAAAGDRLAKRILSEAAEALVLHAVACASRLANGRAPVEFLVTGSVLKKQPAFARAVARRLRAVRPNSRVKPLGREGAWGAVAYALEEWLKERTAGAASAQKPKPATQQAPFVPASSGLSPTERQNPRSKRLDRLPLRRAIRLMLREDARIPGALLREIDRIEAAVGLIARTLRSGGRLFYVGAGTSGRLGVLDASECPPTFRSPPSQVQGIMAGGQTALWSSIEGEEDDAEAGGQAVACRGVTRKDVVVGIAASGRTPYVWGALQAARRRGARIILVCFNPNLVFQPQATPDLVIAPEVGPEVLTGSTRLKAGTATKLLLNIFTTLAMVQLGKVIGNLMVDLNPSNTKLRDRAARIVTALTGANRAAAEVALEKSRWVVKKAISSLGRAR
jgi:N-acetylmuramic acid 6-phosphate etherase